MTDQWPSLDEMRDWAGERAFERGSRYFFEGRVQVERISDGTIRGEAHGTDAYALWLKQKDGEWRWHCECPAAEGGAFCKHLIAAVMAAANDAVRKAPDGESAAKESPVATKPDELLAFLRAQPAERLAGWLHELAQDDRDVEKRLQLYRAAEQPAVLKTALGKLISTGGFLDYRGAMRYAQRLEAGIEQLHDLLTRDPAECRALCEYALKRLFKVYGGNADDSAGAIGECLHQIADLHAQACEAAPPGKALAKPLHDLKCADDWGLFPLARYWQALGHDGQADFVKRVLMEFERLPAVAAPEQRYGESFGVVRRTEELARHTQDFELLQRVLRRDLSHSWDHLKVLESLREFGRGREALVWAEAAVKRFPDDSRLRVALSDCLAEAGLHDEALGQRWQCFVERPCDDYWDGLKRMSGKDWPEWRVRALELVASSEKGVVSRRIGLLLHDGDLQAAVQLARDSNKVAVEALLDVADAAKRSQPEAAGSFYLRAARAWTDRLNGASDYKRFVGYLVAASRLLPAAALSPLVSGVREQHRRKPKLMGMLDKAGL
jgi:uncharacterized Zn finger protein